MHKEDNTDRQCCQRRERGHQIIPYFLILSRFPLISSSPHYFSFLFVFVICILSHWGTLSPNEVHVDWTAIYSLLLHFLFVIHAFLKAFSFSLALGPRHHCATITASSASPRVIEPYTGGAIEAYHPSWQWPSFSSRFEVRQLRFFQPCCLITSWVGLS